MGLLIAGFAALFLMGGIVLLVLGVRGTEVSSRPVKVKHDLPPKAKRMRQLQMGGAAVAGMLTWLVSGWLPSAMLVAGAVFFLPWLINPNKAANEQIERLDALAQWTKRLSDLVRTGTGIEESIAVSVRTAPRSIEREVADLNVRLQSRIPTGDALTAFARAIGDPRADLVSAALLLRMKDRGPGLADVLSDLAARTSNVVRRRRDVEADRAKHRTTTRWICTITLVVIVGFSFNKSYIEPYGTPLGMLVLIILMASVVALFWWMSRLGMDKPLPGFMEYDEHSVGSHTDPVLTEVAR